MHHLSYFLLHKDQGKNYPVDYEIYRKFQKNEHLGANNQHPSSWCTINSTFSVAAENAGLSSSSGGGGCNFSFTAPVQQHQRRMNQLNKLTIFNSIYRKLPFYLY